MCIKKFHFIDKESINYVSYFIKSQLKSKEEIGARPLLDGHNNCLRLVYSLLKPCCCFTEKYCREYHGTQPNSTVAIEHSSGIQNIM